MRGIVGRGISAVSLLLAWCGPPALAAETLAPVVVGPGSAITVEAAPGTVAEASIGGGALHPVEGPLEAPASGAHWLAVASRAPSGAVSPVRWTRLVVDDRPPEVALHDVAQVWADPDGRQWLPPTAALVAEAQDRDAGVHSLRLDIADRMASASAGDGPWLAQLAAPSEGGPFELVAQATDRVGNRSEPLRIGFEVDSWVPAGRFRIDGVHLPALPEAETGAILGSSARVALDADDRGSGLAETRFEVDDVTMSLDRLAEPWPEGRHRLAAVLTDRVGNATSIDPLTFTVDATPPTIQWQVTSRWVEGENGKRYHRSPVTVRLSAEDEVAGLATYRAANPKDGEVRTLDLLGETTLLVDGDALHLEATDRVGNQSNAGAQWQIDDSPPTVVVSVAGRPLVDREVHALPVGSRLRFEVEDGGAGVSETTMFLDRLTVPGRRAPRPLSDEILLGRRGRYSLVVATEDRLGNRHEQRWRIDVGVTR